MNTTPRPAPDTAAMASYDDVFTFLRANGALDHPMRYRIDAAGILNQATGAEHPCDTTPLYEILGAPFGAQLTIGATQVEITQHVLLYDER